MSIYKILPLYIVGDTDGGGLRSWQNKLRNTQRLIIIADNSKKAGLRF